MAAEPTQLHPAVQFLKDNAVVIGLVLIVAVSVAVFAILQGAAKPETQSEVKPAAQATAALGTAGPTASAGPGAAPGSTASPGSSAGAQTATGGSPTTSATPRIIGTGPQSVTAKDWKPYAKEFAVAWANTAGGKDEWLKRLKPLASPSLYAGFQSTDIRVIPSDTFDSVSLAEESPGFKTFHAYFQNSGLVFDGRVQVQPDGSWLVDHIGPPKK